MNMVNCVQNISEVSGGTCMINHDDLMQIYRDREVTDRISAYANGKVDARHEFALSLLKEKMSPEFICRHTGISPEELHALQASQPS